MSGYFGIFKEDLHIYTYANETSAKKMASRLGLDYEVRELTLDEYWKRMKALYPEGKYSGILN